MKLAFCVACGNTADLHHSRLVPSGGDEQDNLITLCGSCHVKLSKRGPTKRRLVEEAQARAEALRPLLAELSSQSTYAIAAELNRRGVPTAGSGPWRSMTVLRVLNRLKEEG